MPEDMPEDVPEDMPDRMPDRMPEDMSDRMPEDLPVRKSINVMAGITRSKVFRFYHSCSPPPRLAVWAEDCRNRSVVRCNVQGRSGMSKRHWAWRTKRSQAVQVSGAQSTARTAWQGQDNTRKWEADQRENKQLERKTWTTLKAMAETW